jgi:hypothetical protein
LSEQFPAAAAYLALKRTRALAPTTIRIVKEIVARFGARRLTDVAVDEWKGWVDTRQRGNAAATRERFINAVLAFAREHHRLKSLPAFERDKQSRNPRRRHRRRVDDLRPDLIARLHACAPISLRAQLAAEWSTCARVSSVLYGARICDVALAPGRETIVFRDTKNGPGRLGGTASDRRGDPTRICQMARRLT